MKNKEYPIRVVTKITGLSADQIRKWEERYSILNINRSVKGSRRFNDKDLELLQLMVQAKNMGFSLQEIGELKLKDLRSMVASFDGSSVNVTYPELEQLSDVTKEYFDICIDSLREYNISKMERAIYDVAMELGAVYVIHKFMVPFIKHVGRLWKNNRISKPQERFANAVIKNYLENYRSSFKSFNADNPTALIATPKGQRAELGCLVNSCLSVAAGWNNVYLGTDLSATDLIQAVHESKSSCLILSVLYPLDDASLCSELEKIRSGIGDHIDIVINGKKSSFYADTYKSINAKVVHDLFSMPSLLEDVKAKFVV